MELHVDRDEATPTLTLDFDPFFHAHFPKVARAAAFVARDEGIGQELAQEAFVRALQRWGDLESDEHARNFVYKVAINLARSHMRKYARVRPYGLTGFGDRHVEAVNTTEDRIELFEALGGLTPRQRACVVLVDYVDMAPDAVARILGTSATTVRVHVMRGRSVLRDRLGYERMEEPR